MFLELAFDATLYFVSVVVTVVISIVLHELAHGWAATFEGDDTPASSGHLTPNPIVHMGPLSIIMLLTCGMAFGAMPVNPVNFRHRHGDALVSAAGPAMNLLLALVALTAVALWMRTAGFWEDLGDFAGNVQYFLWTFGEVNLALLALNLLPIPPLDGSRILADFHGGYRRWVRRVNNPHVFFIALLVILIVASRADLGLFDGAAKVSLWYVNLVGDQTLHFD